MELFDQGDADAHAGTLPYDPQIGDKKPVGKIGDAEADTDDAALGEYFSTELGVFDAIPEVFRYYIDTEKYGRDLRLSMDMCHTSYGTIIRD